MQLYNLEFAEEEIRQAAAADRLLSMEIEFSRECNFRCAYCYLEERTAAADELSRQELKAVILQARELGARKVIILGGEPSIYPHLIEMLRFLGSLGLEIELFTNGTGVTKELASVLAEERVRVVVKMNSRDAAIQDHLAGKNGAFKIIGQALDSLHRAGLLRNHATTDGDHAPLGGVQQGIVQQIAQELLQPQGMAAHAYRNPFQPQVDAFLCGPVKITFEDVFTQSAQVDGLHLLRLERFGRVGP